jgi:hypothetical protein
MPATFARRTAAFRATAASNARTRNVRFTSILLKNSQIKQLRKSPSCAHMDLSSPADPPRLHAACCRPLAALNTLIISRLNVGMSLGLRPVTRLRSTTTS